MPVEHHMGKIERNRAKVGIVWKISSDMLLGFVVMLVFVDIHKIYSFP